MVAAAIGAVGSVAGAAISGKGASKAAAIQAQTAAANRAQAQQFYNDATSRYSGDIAQADTASGVYAGLLGDGGDATASANALATWKNSAGYQSQLADTLKATDASAYANGMGRSGAAMKALQDNASKLNSNYLQTYLGNLNTQVQTGANAKSALTGAGTTSLATTTAANTAEGTAASNAALSQASTYSNLINKLGNLGADAYTTSYGKK